MAAYMIFIRDKTTDAGELAIEDCTEAVLGRLMAGAEARVP